jgi:hypothetical protein
VTLDRTYDFEPLVSSILQPRPGFETLTNQRCVQHEAGKCIEREVREYDLRDREVRRKLNELKFICNVAGERFRVAPYKAALCQYRRSGGVLGIGRKLKEHKCIGLDRYQFLIDADTRCFQEGRYPF